MARFDGVAWSLVHYLMFGREGKNLPVFDTFTQVASPLSLFENCEKGDQAACKCVLQALKKRVAAVEWPLAASPRTSFPKGAAFQETTPRQSR